MTTPQRATPVSRRTALAGLGAGGLGVALAAPAHTAAVQDAPADLAAHPIVGCWQNAVDDPGVKWTFSIFHADGTYHEWNGSPVTAQRSAAMGVWRPSGERTADAVFMYQQVDPSTQDEFTATWRVVVTVEDTGDALTYDGDVDLRGRTEPPCKPCPGPGRPPA